MQTTDFQLNASSQAFKILSSSLYEDKERAVLRETVANAWDSHLEAGITTPVDITLPTESVPVLLITDYGIGMSHTQLTGIYSTYFSSTKASDNKLIGGFGLGSKSPFAITDEFTITSVHNGEHSIVKAFLDAGVPKLDTLLHEHNTNLPNGTEVSIPVLSTTRQSLLRDALYSGLFSYWSIPPKVTNDEPIKVAKRNIIESTEVNVTGTYSTRSIDLSSVILGGFKYLVPANIINRLDRSSCLYPELTQYVKLLGGDCYSTNVVITPILPIGSIELAPSRERIEDTEGNYQAILAAIQQAGKQLLPTAMSTLTTVTDMLHTLTLSVHTLDHYKAVVDYYNDLPESNQALFGIAIKKVNIPTFTDTLKEQLSALSKTIFFLNGYVSNVRSLPTAVNASLAINPTSYKLTSSNAIKTTLGNSLRLIGNLVHNKPVYIHVTDSPKANVTKSIINHCIRTDTPVNGKVIPVEDHYAVTSSDLHKLTNLFDNDNIVILTADLMAPYKPTRQVTKAAKSTKVASPDLGYIVYSSTGLERISVADFYSLPDTTYIIAMPEISERCYSRGINYQSNIPNYYVPLVKAMGSTKDILIIKLPRSELTNKRFNDCNNINVLIDKDSSDPLNKIIEDTTTSSTRSTIKRMTTINNNLMGYNKNASLPVYNWVKTLFTSNQQKILNTIDNYKTILRLVSNTNAYKPKKLELSNKEASYFVIVSHYLSDIDNTKEIINFDVAAKIFRRVYKD